MGRTVAQMELPSLRTIRRPRLQARLLQALAQSALELQVPLTAPLKLYLLLLPALLRQRPPPPPLGLWVGKCGEMGTVQLLQSLSLLASFCRQNKEE